MAKLHITKIIKTTPEDLIRNSKAFDPDVEQQGQALERLYAFVMGQVWDAAKKFHGSPTVGSKFWQAICQRFIDFDRAITNPRIQQENIKGGERQLTVLPGGCWMSQGFSVDERMAEDTIIIDFDYDTKEG